MPVPTTHQKRRVYHFTHFYNLKSVLQHGFLSFNEQIRLNLRHTSIAAASIQERRAKMVVPCGPGGLVHDYVPLYFGKTSPMLLKQVSAKNLDQSGIVYFIFPVQLIERADTVFTNAAANTAIPPAFYDDPGKLNLLKWDVIDSSKWKSADDTKQMRMAEVLVHKHLDPKLATNLVVWNRAVESNVKEIYGELNLSAPDIQFEVYGDTGYWFTHFDKKLPADMLNVSIAPGPIETKETCDDALDFIAKNGGRPNARFNTPAELLQALNADFAALPETSELIGLESSNEVHKENVGDHTLKVLAELRKLAVFKALEPNKAALVELAAYLHDIGKGPKSRWEKTEGKQKPDAAHPLRSVEMLKRILTEEVRTVSPEEARVLTKLVGYHDLIGDIQGKQRDRHQLLSVAENKEDLEMLLALGRADMSSIAGNWAMLADIHEDQLRDWALEEGLGKQ